ncbi:MAG: hypothetical protein Q7R95_04710 [bacterium]|nr:hypothetical protein [bacterium]
MANLNEVERAERKGIKLLEVLRSPFFSLEANRINIDDGDEKPFQLHEPNSNRIVDYYATIPGSDSGDLFELVRGTLITMETFCEVMGGKKDTSFGNAEKLKSDHFGNERDLAFLFDSQYFSCNIFHGSDISYAQKIREIANMKNGFNVNNKRAEYQLNVKETLTPIIHKTDKSKPQIWIQEDCAATLETVLGVMGIAINNLHFQNGGTVRIDVLTATPQALLLANKFAEDNKIKIEFNVGYLAPGLHEGELKEGVYRGACYIMQEDMKTYTVGDIGDGGKQLPEQFNDTHRWNEMRENAPNINAFQKLDSLKSYIIRLLRGGAFIGSLYEYMIQGYLTKFDLIQFFASRTHDEQRGPGVAVFLTEQ